MGFLKGNATFVRFRTNIPRPVTFGESHLVALRERALGRLAPASDTRVGWAAGESVLDGDFTELKQVWPDHLLFDFWVETSKLPADLLHAYYAADLKALARHNPSGFPSARQKREAKASARDRLEREAADGRFVKRKTIPVAWDAARGEVLFGSTSAAAATRFMALFEQTFGGTLSPVTAGELATRFDATAADETLSRFVNGVTPDEAGWQVGDGHPDFLGNEFLLWLWHVADEHSDTLQLPDGTEATFMFSGGIRVEDPRGQTGNGTMNSDSAVRLPEARAAVKAGKLPRKAALTAVRQGDQFAFVLQAETFAVSAGKPPKPGDDVSGRARDEHRLQALRGMTETLDLMFGAFLTVRLSAAWENTLADVRAWLGRSRVSA